MIPIVLEAAAMNDQEVVEDWALDAPSQKLLLSHNAAKKGNTQESSDRQLGSGSILIGPYGPRRPGRLKLPPEMSRDKDFRNQGRRRPAGGLYHIVYII